MQIRLFWLITLILRLSALSQRIVVLFENLQISQLL